MVQLSTGMDASVGVPGYERHRPEKTLLYQLVEQHYPAYVTQLATDGKVLPDYVHEEFEAHTGAVTLIQRFGGALNLNIHFHMLLLDGVYVDRGGKLDRFRWVKAPTTAELSELIHTVAYRIGRYLELSIPVEDSVSGRHNACNFRAGGFHCQAGCSGAQASGEPDPLPRCISTEQQAPSISHASTARKRSSEEHNTARPAERTNQPSCGHELGTETQAGLQHRCREMSDLRRQSQGHCRDRGQCHHRQDTHTFGEQGVLCTNRAVAASACTTSGRVV